ncbi:MAG: peptidoglycan-binding domain-containing protein [Solirubrobacteraceae bacterium]
MLAREFAVAPTVADPPAVNLTAAQLRGARLMNEVLFVDADEIAVIRDVLGISREPSVVDDDLSNALARYQAQYGLTADGKLGPRTAAKLSAEMTAEADADADPPRGTELRRVAQRLQLRSMASRTRGTYASQDFVGPDDMPTGAVTVRLGDTEGGVDNMISLEYTGADANTVHWLQFVSMQMFATPPGAAAPVFATGTVDTSNGPEPWASPGTPNWTVDSVPNEPAGAPSPFYDVSGGMNTAAANRRIAMLDAPGGDSVIDVAHDFATSGAAAGATTVTFRDVFSSYVVKGGRAVYRVDYTAITVANVAAGTAGQIRYTQRFNGQVRGLLADHVTALAAKFPTAAIR